MDYAQNPYYGNTYQQQYRYSQYNVPQPQSYQVQNPTQAPYQVQNLTQAPNTFQWVQGEAGAKAFMVAPGNSVLLMDSENPVIYMKSTDINGRPLPMKTYDLIERQERHTPAQPDVDFGSFVKRDELTDAISAMVEKEVSKKLSEISFKPSKNSKEN